jgi:hypothetical protein
VRSELVRQSNDAITDDAGFTGVGPELLRIVNFWELSQLRSFQCIATGQKSIDGGKKALRVERFGFISVGPQLQ